MAYIKRLKVMKDLNQEKAIRSHAGFVRYVSGKIEKLGYEEVLKNKSFKWLKKAFDRLLDFAERLQLQDRAKPLIDQSTETHTHFTVIVPKENGKESLSRINPEASGSISSSDE